MKVRDVMTKDLWTVDLGASLADAAKLMWEHDRGCVPVVDPKTRSLVGVVTDRDACMSAYTKGQPLQRIGVQDAMAKRVVSVKPDDDTIAACETLERHQLHRLPVTDSQGKLVGMVTLNDLACSAAKVNGREHQQMCSVVGETLAAVGQPRELAATS